MRWLFAVAALVYVTACGWTLHQYHLFASVAGRLTLCGLAALAIMLIMFYVARRQNRLDIVDTGWGLSFVAIAVTGFVLQNGPLLQWKPQDLVVIMVCLWALRLSWFIFSRWRRSPTEDVRYTNIRKKWSSSQIGLRALLSIFVLQAFLAVLVSIPVIHITLSSDVVWSGWMLAGGLICASGLLLEPIADYQAAQYLRQKKRPPLLTTGLRKNVRHPNYLGELLVWWGFAIMSLGTPHGWVGLGGAAAITYLLVYVSGVPLKEQRLARHKGWEAYKAKTPALIPGFNHR